MNKAWWLNSIAALTLAAVVIVSEPVNAHNNTLLLKPDIIDQFNPSTEAAPGSEETPHRIVGGEPISIRRAPYQVAVILDRMIDCGGSVISRYWVLTAAHCVTGNLGDVRVRAGTRYFKRGGQTRRIVLVVRNGDYNEISGAGDIAMLRVSRPFTFSNSLRPVRLASRNARLPRAYYVTGWGTTSENGFAVRRGLRGTSVALVSRRTCVRQYQGEQTIPLRTLCAAAPGRDSCSGDSGGALVNDNVQYGIVAFGIGCARRNYAGVYTDVRFYRSWISLVAQRYQSYSPR